VYASESSVSVVRVVQGLAWADDAAVERWIGECELRYGGKAYRHFVFVSESRQAGPNGRMYDAARQSPRSPRPADAGEGIVEALGTPTFQGFRRVDRNGTVRTVILRGENAFAPVIGGNPCHLLHAYPWRPYTKAFLEIAFFYVCEQELDSGSRAQIENFIRRNGLLHGVVFHFQSTINYLDQGHVPDDLPFLAAIRTAKMNLVKDRVTCNARTAGIDCGGSK
jgi:hypothetical protein